LVVTAVAFPHALSRYPILPALCHSTPNPQSLLSVSPSFLIGLGLMLSGAWLRLWCYRSMGKLFTFEVALKPSHQLIVAGPYAYVRHPSYTAGVVHIGGLVVLHFSSGGWNRECHVMSTLAGLVVLTYLGLALFSFISWDKRSKLEDELLRERFGCEWQRYYADVPWRFLPGIC
jgi:protein-S-isoprenylcysteine O-methyltransferase Ste14